MWWEELAPINNIEETVEGTWDGQLVSGEAGG